MAKVLRPYQLDLKNDIYDAWKEGHKNVLAVMPTGGGKTATFVNIAIDIALKSYFGTNYPTAILVHRKELVQQISLTLAEEGVSHNIIAPRPVIKGIVAAQRRLFNKQFYDYSAPITVISVDTLNARILKHEEWAKSIKFWITDEAAHLLKENKWGRAVKYFTNAIGLGVTATPQRLDKRGLGSHVDGVFDIMVQGPTSRWMIQQGFLSKYKIALPESDYETYLKAANEGSDYSKEAMIKAAQESQIVGDVVKNYIKFSDKKQAIVFASDILSGERIEKEFISKGIKAKLLTGETPDNERLSALIDYQNRLIQVLINIDLFDEGLDVPGIETVIMARPTMSLGKYLQCCLDTDTEILTDNGWKKHNTITHSDKAAAFKDGIIDYVKIKRIIKRKREIDEKMYSFENSFIDFRVTSQHDMVVKSRKTKVWKKETIDTTVKRKELFHIPNAGLFRSSAVANLTDDELLFLGWFLSDGTRHKNNNVIVISQSIKSPYIQEIRDLLKRMRVKNSEFLVKRTDKFKNYSDLLQFNIPIFKPERKFQSWENKNDISHLDCWLNKELPEIYNTLNETQIAVLLSSWFMGDGCKKKDIDYKPHTMTICMGSDKKMTDRLQQLLILRNYRCVISELKPHKNKIIQSKKTQYILRIKKVKTSSIAGNNVKDGKILDNKKYTRSRIKTETVYKDELVWCIENEWGTIVTRRKGKIVIMGNCGRGLRPHKDKPFMILIDHVGNVRRHGLPDTERRWTLDRISKRSQKVNLIRICKNFMCNSPFDRMLSVCPYCGEEDKPIPRGEGGGLRSALEQVDGDLLLLDPDSIRQLEKNVMLEDPARTAQRVERATGSEAAGKRAAKNQVERIAFQQKLADEIARAAGKLRHRGYGDRAINKRFYIEFGMTIWDALALPKAEMQDVMARLEDWSRYA